MKLVEDREKKTFYFIFFIFFHDLIQLRIMLISVSTASALWHTANNKIHRLTMPGVLPRNFLINATSPSLKVALEVTSNISHAS